MKKQLAIVLGMSLAAGAAVAGNEGEYTESDTMDTETTSQSEILDSAELDSGEDMTGEDMGTSTAMNFEDLDVNQDSLISEQEATDSQLLDSEAFASADTNQDGYLSQTEFDAQGSASIEDPAELETETETEIDDAS
ncbi:MAG: hypothetical protein H0W33_01910 [Gammaproteobacteria bacterium]|nr:hypothetical protein [Gammaproteobacteria bacterium]